MGHNGKNVKPKIVKGSPFVSNESSVKLLSTKLGFSGPTWGCIFTTKFTYCVIEAKEAKQMELAIKDRTPYIRDNYSS